MLVFAVNNPLIHVPTAPTVSDVKSVAVADEKDASAPSAAEGIKVTISPDAFKAAKSASTDSDIDESGLDDNVKQILKMIRKLKQQIDEKLAELQAVAVDQSLTPEERQAKTATLQSAISSLQAGLITAEGSLAKAMKGMSPEQLGKVLALSR
ncbi:hypothetical protein [Pseudomonas poae]|uniref:Chemotaxis protein n=1 Tax=Pseudomonas poae TaxID=200451 RepID=A0A2S9ENQ2_9PSED|nr:hypothetical protein [Pseudomonas poae]PRA26523.1 hypothetical protein CQZ97_20000 [Pseudomonas poae]PRC17024.1 hypothetical protein CQZ99_15485 [Pseudomonas poae]